VSVSHITGKARPFQNVESYEVYFNGRLLALLANIRLGCKGLPETNVLAYYEKAQLKTVKSFITLAPGSVLYNVLRPYRNKLACLSLPTVEWSTIWAPLG